ncbi:FAAH [Bugula neritina]|uniref:FAAH n=1 Tax=Bugula neritina TaxID=10212 RepID=A0A7J7J4N6_BUGNE|nr:FAAH [Bugula neritina]
MMKPADLTFETLIGYLSWKFNFNFNRNHYLTISSLPICIVLWLLQKDRNKWKKQYLDCLRDEFSSKLYSQRVQVQTVCQLKVSAERAKEITSLSFTELQSKLQKRELLCIEVLYAYQRVAFTENVKLNFIVQPVLEAEKIARRLDGLPASETDKLPLFGIPFSLKENFGISGYQCTVGASKLIDDSSTDHTCPTVRTLIDAGAVPFIRTNIPQTMMSLGAHNPIYGQTRNPLDLARSPGGSSAGEGAAVGSGSSIIGLGSDIGGSVRVPAAWCGVTALKPSTDRFSACFMNRIGCGQTLVRGVPGLVGRNVAALVEFSKVLCSDFQYNNDTAVPRTYFNSKEYLSTKPLTIGYLYYWPIVEATESAKNAVTRVVRKLSSQGHKVVEWELPQFDCIPHKLLRDIFFADGGTSIFQLLENDEVSYTIKRLFSKLGWVDWFKYYLAYAVGWLLPSWFTKKHLVGIAGVENVNKWFQLTDTVEKYRQMWVQDWRDKGIDVLITPAVPVPAEFIDQEEGCISLVSTLALLLLLRSVNTPY